MIEGDRIPDEVNQNLEPEDRETVDPEDLLDRMAAALETLDKEELNNILDDLLGYIIHVFYSENPDTLIRTIVESGKFRGKTTQDMVELVMELIRQIQSIRT